jgi:hypothetical protein
MTGESLANRDWAQLAANRWSSVLDDANNGWRGAAAATSSGPSR